MTLTTRVRATKKDPLSWRREYGLHSGASDTPTDYAHGVTTNELSSAR